MAKTARYYCVCRSWDDAMAAAAAMLTCKLEDIGVIADIDGSRWLICGRGIPEYKLIAARVD